MALVFESAGRPLHEEAACQEMSCLAAPHLLNSSLLSTGCGTGSAPEPSRSCTYYVGFLDVADWQTELYAASINLARQQFRHRLAQLNKAVSAHIPQRW